MIQSVASLLPLQGSSVNPVNQNGQSSQLDFGKYLENALNNVNNSIVQSQQLGEELAAGKVSDIHTVMIAAQKASLQLQLAVQIRNKAIAAYQEVMRIQV